MSQNVIAIDGPAASGKSSVASALSQRLHIPYINTGNMYRAITWKALQNGIKLSASHAEDSIMAILSQTELNYSQGENGEFVLLLDGEQHDREIRAPEVAEVVSLVAAMPLVRHWLLELQRRMTSFGLLVMEGRDIGTVIFPDAKFKFFITASPEIRAERRLKQSGETFDGATLASIARSIAERDHIDSTRAVAPLQQAEDAVLIDTTNLSIAEVVAKIIGIIKVAEHNKI